LKWSLSLFVFLFAISGQSATAPFRFHLGSEPASLKPWEQRNSAAGYFFSAVTASLMKYQDRKLSGNLAEKCIYLSDLKLSCQIRRDSKWQNGQAIKPEHFKKAFLKILNPESKSFQADLLFPIKNAKQFYLGAAKDSEVGIQIQNQKLIFELEEANREFIYTLASPILSPIPDPEIPNIEDIQKNPESYLSAGPYVIESWESLKKIKLKSNPFFWIRSNRPNIEIIFVSEDSVAVSLYESGKLDLLRRLPTAFIPKYKGTPEFFEIDQFRFDYLGFSPKWQSAENKSIRQSIAQAIDYVELQKLYVAKSPPGCPGIPKALYDGQICIQFNKDLAVTSFAKISEKPKSFALMYSKQGGDDHKRSMEWIQGQLKNNLSFSISSIAMEDKIYTERLKTDPPDFFRRGIAPVRPTCLAALQNFKSDNLENYIRFSNPKFDELLKRLQVSRLESDKRQLCAEALKLLIDDFRLIPTGPLYFTLLAKTNFAGWKLNELNQLDLSELRHR
jgi:oligopeptide transport system substrate-binding protein